MRHSLKARLDDQKKLTMRWSSMITRTNRFKQFQAKDKFESHCSNHISRFETRRKTRYQHILAAIRFNIHCSKQIFIKKNSWVCIHRNNDSLTEFHQIVQKKKIVASEKTYNRHVLEKKQFTNKTFIFIYYRLLFQKYEHDSIFSWSQTTRSIHFTRFLLYSWRFYRCTSKRSRARFWLYFLLQVIFINYLESILSKVYFRIFKRYRFF
jgi:hypothetical protein